MNAGFRFFGVRRAGDMDLLSGSRRLAAVYLAVDGVEVEIGSVYLKTGDDGGLVLSFEPVRYRVGPLRVSTVRGADRGAFGGRVLRAFVEWRRWHGRAVWGAARGLR